MTSAIPLSFPDITDAEIQAVVRTLRSGRLSIGQEQEEFERLVALRAHRSYGIAVNSGTSALHLTLLALGIGPGDEVITPAFSFVASANCVEYVGAKPVFVDCDPRTLNMKTSEVDRKITEKTKAIIGVEVFGNPSGMDQLAALSTKYEIPLIEDACEALGGRVGNEPVGAFGRIAVFGFYPNKQITTGEGGMIVTDDDHIADICRSLRNHGRPSETMEAGSGMGSWLDHQQLGFNYRMSEIAAALGVAQMRRLDELIDARQTIAEAYTRRLMGNPELIIPSVEPNTHMSWFVYVVRLSDHFTPDDRDEIIAGLRRHELGTSNYFPPIPLMNYYRRKYGFGVDDFPIAHSVGGRTIALPFFSRMTEREVDLVCQTLELMMTRVRFVRD